MVDGIEIKLDVSKASKEELIRALRMYQAGYILQMSNYFGIASKAVKEAEVFALQSSGMFNKLFLDEVLKHSNYFYDVLSEKIKDLINEFEVKEFGTVIPALIMALGRVYVETVSFMGEKIESDYMAILDLIQKGKLDL